MNYVKKRIKARSELETRTISAICDRERREELERKMWYPGHDGHGRYTRMVVTVLGGTGGLTTGTEVSHDGEHWFDPSQGVTVVAGGQQCGKTNLLRKLFKRFFK